MVGLPRNVVVNVTTASDDGEDETYGYRARLLRIEGTHGLCERRAGSDLPTGLYPIEDIFDAKTKERVD